MNSADQKRLPASWYRKGQVVVCLRGKAGDFFFGKEAHIIIEFPGPKSEVESRKKDAKFLAAIRQRLEEALTLVDSFEETNQRNLTVDVNDIIQLAPLLGWSVNLMSRFYAVVSDLNCPPLWQD